MTVYALEPLEPREDDDEPIEDEAVRESDFDYLAAGELIEADVAAMTETTL